MYCDRNRATHLQYSSGENLSIKQPSNGAYHDIRPYPT